MHCPICRNLEQAYEARLSEYIKARSSACFRLCTKLAARKNVEMERALIELEEHRSVCRSAINESTRLPVVTELCLKHKEAFRVRSVGTAA